MDKISYSVTKSLHDFKAWGTAIDTIKKMDLYDTFDDVAEYISYCQDNGMNFSDIDINDLLADDDEVKMIAYGEIELYKAFDKQKVVKVDKDPKDPIEYDSDKENMLWNAIYGYFSYGDFINSEESEKYHIEYSKESKEYHLIEN